MACINNLVLGILLGKLKFRYLPHARRYFAAHPDEALALINQLYKRPVLTSLCCAVTVKNYYNQVS